MLTREPAERVLLALLGEAQHDPEFARTLHHRYLEPRRKAERQMLAHGIENGQTPDLRDARRGSRPRRSRRAAPAGAIARRRS
ncbi:MAG: TetR/AcrR family transcriptional regulator C-terminal ligand-binding domain-containing protein [Solirubrobacterales bacterium]|nr:TetR/AcrR family transcriptional regulator C-terminal ligand-binding domain-containing protein [Solirubrobacterales bacterium]